MSYLKCDTTPSLIDANTASCASGWINSAPDYDILINQLVAINEFDPAKVQLMLVFFLVEFITAFVVGMVISKMRKV